MPGWTGPTSCSTLILSCTTGPSIPSTRCPLILRAPTCTPGTRAQRRSGCIAGMNPCMCVCARCCDYIAQGERTREVRGPRGSEPGTRGQTRWRPRSAWAHRSAWVSKNSSNFWICTSRSGREVRPHAVQHSPHGDGATSSILPPGSRAGVRRHAGGPPATVAVR